MNEKLDQILKFLERENWYVEYDIILEKFNINDSEKKYILSKLETDGYIDISRSKTSLNIKINDLGRIFINETGYYNEYEQEKKFNESIKKEIRFDLIYKVLIIILTITSSFLGYKTLNKDTIISKQQQKIEKLETENKQINIEFTDLHFFSNNENKDTFKLHMQGDNIINSEIEFSIKTSAGNQIFLHKFKSTDLIGYEFIGIESPTFDQKKNYILKRFYNFFDESNFSKPAISKDEEFDNDYYFEEYFETIKKQGDCVSFYYLIGEEYMRRIVYLKNQKKVVRFWECC